MRRAVTLSVLIALMLGAGVLHPAMADAPKAAKPVLVVSFSGYDEAMRDLRVIGEIGDHPGLDKNIEGVLSLFTKGRGLAGVDKKRPWGAVIQTDGGKPTGYGFIPVTDLGELLALLEKLGHKSKDAGDGITEIETKRKDKHLFVRAHNGWALLAEKPEILADVPADPAKLIAGLPQQYDWAVRLNVSDMPEECRDKFIECLKKKGQKCLQRKKGSKKRQAVRKMIAGRVLQEIDKATDEIEQITLGWGLDHHARKGYLELTVTALEGTDAAKQFAELGNAKTDLAGFVLPGAAVSGRLTAQRLGVDREEVTALFKAIRAAAFERIEEKIENEEKAEGAKKFVAGMLQVAAETVASGRVDRAGSLVLKPDGVTVVAARYVADGHKLEKTLGMVVKAARKKRPEVVDKLFTPNAEEHQGVRLHVLSIPIPKKCKDREKAVALVGEKLEVVVGISKHHVGFAAGKDALKTLKQAIDDSIAQRGKTVQPLRFAVSLGQVADFLAVVAKEKDKSNVEKLAALLEKHAGSDRITVAATPIKRGVKYRLEFEEGALRVLGKLHELKKKR